MQLIAHNLGGKVERSSHPEYGAGTLTAEKGCPLFAKLPTKLEVWNSHGDRITKLPTGFTPMGTTENSPHAVIGDSARHIYGMQFHPRSSTRRAARRSFRTSSTASAAARRTGRWARSSTARASRFARRSRGPRDPRPQRRRGFLRRGGAVAQGHRRPAHLHLRGQRLIRKGEREAVEKLFGDHFHIKLKVVDASKRFLTKLAGVTDPRRSARSSATNSSRSSRPPPSNSRNPQRAGMASSSSLRALLTRTSSSPSPSGATRPRSSRATTMSAACPSA